MRVLCLIVLLCASPLYAADILVCRDSKTAVTVRSPESVEGRHFVKMPLEGWEAVPPHFIGFSDEAGAVKVITIGQNPSIESIKAGVELVKTENYDCIQLYDTTRDDACSSLSAAITRVADPVCNTILELGEAVAASAADGTTASAKCKRPNGHVRISVICEGG